MDTFDKRILEHLQQDCTIAVSALAKKVGLGTTACWRRVNKLESEGIIQKRVALLDPAHLNVSVDIYVALKTDIRCDMKVLQRALQVIPEVIEAHRMAGDVDYLLRVVVPNMAAYDQVQKCLRGIDGVSDVSANVAIGQVKATTMLPLHYVDTVS